MADIRLGALCWNQYTDWPSLLEAGRRVDRLGYHSLWTWDHVYPIVGSPDGPMFEGWLTLAAWAQATERVRIGLMVGANTFREPALTAKMATTLDHISNGRAILGIGGAWFETEHEAFGISFGDGFPERLRWLGEALPIMRGMLRGEAPTASGPRYHAREVRNDPPPIQARLPLLIGGGGEQVTLKLVARYGDANNVGGGFENVKRKEAILVQHCETVGRDPAEIEISQQCVVVIAADDAGAREALEKANKIYGGHMGGNLAEHGIWGTPDQVIERIERYVKLGCTLFVMEFFGKDTREPAKLFAERVLPAFR